MVKDIDVRDAMEHFEQTMARVDEILAECRKSTNPISEDVMKVVDSINKGKTFTRKNGKTFKYGIGMTDGTITFYEVDCESGAAKKAKLSSKTIDAIWDDFVPEAQPMGKKMRWMDGVALIRKRDAVPKYKFQFEDGRIYTF